MNVKYYLLGACFVSFFYILFSILIGYFGIKADSPYEEGVEQVLDAMTGMHIDLTPE